MGLEPLVRALFVGAHQPRVARDISGEDRSETTGHGHVSGSSARRKPSKINCQTAALLKKTEPQRSVLILRGGSASKGWSIDRASSKRPRCAKVLASQARSDEGKFGCSSRAR